MNRFLRSLTFASQVLAIFAVTTTLFGQAIPPRPLSDAEFSSQIEARMKQLGEVTDLDEATKTKIKDLYTQALSEMKTVNKWAELSAQNEKLANTAPNDLRNTKAALVLPVTKVLPNTTPNDSLSKIEQDISTGEAEFVRLQKALADSEAELKNGADRRAKTTLQLNKAKDTLTSLNEQLQWPAPANQSPMMNFALRVVLEARRRSVEQEIACYEQELKTYEARTELLPLCRDLNARKVASCDHEIKQWQAFVNQRRQTEAEQQLQKAAAEAGQAPQAVRELVETNIRLAKERKRLAEHITEITAQRERVNQCLSVVTKDFKQITEKVKAAEKSKTTELIGVDLQKRRESLPDLEAYRHNITLQQQMIGQGQLELQPLQDRRAELSDIDLQSQILVQQLLAESPDRNQTELVAAVRESLKNRKDYLDALTNDYHAYFDKILDLIGIEQQLIKETEECARFIDERVLWVASANPLDVGDFRYAWEAFGWLVGPKAWQDIIGTLLTDIKRNSGEWSLALALFVVLFYSRMRMRNRIQEIGEKTERGSCYQFLPTAEVAVWTGLVAIGWPGLMWYFGWRLNSTAGLTTVSKPLGEGLIETARVYLALELLRYTCCKNGLGESHFGWPAPALKLLRQSIRWFSVPALTLMGVAVTMAWQEQDKTNHWDASLGRISFISAMLCFAIVLHRVLRPASDVFRAMITERRGGLTERFRYFWYPLIVLTPTSLAVLAAFGYHYTARQLVIRAILCLYVLVGGIVCRALAFRWTLVNQRRLAMDEARKRRAAQTDNNSGAEMPEVSATAVSERDLATINTQTRRMIEYSLGVACLLVIFTAWVDVLPALGSINYAIGTAPSTVITCDQASGKLLYTEELREVRVSDLLLALIILATTITAARNIPGLLEMAILQHLPFDAGSRYAVVTVCRYLLIVIGVTWCCSFLGIGWSKIQWLAAAMSLGLGFGLQEIFANFVSGLIILFERPIRVGDVVTIDTVTGAVSRIRMRATTIIDADRKELIIPNKEFITGRVLNWTLTDQVNRVIINVGVAYGTNTDRTAKLLLQVAKDHATVLKDPPPQVTLESFGDSSLNFRLYCFLPNLDNRITVIHELNMAVERQFREAGIEIPFPTHDVRIHTADSQTPPAGNVTWSDLTNRAA
jgi:potassium efflux system protein